MSLYGFCGEHRHVVDTKNRLFIPAKFREDLGETFYITRKIVDNCLAIYSAEEWQIFSEKLNTLPDSHVGMIKRFVFSKTVQVTPDSHGRVVLPASLLAYAEIDKNVVIAGHGDHIQIWNEEMWDKMESEIDRDELKRLMREYNL